MVQPLFQIKVNCLVCQTDFQTSRVRPSFKKSIRTDTDFCLHYKEINPDYYVVRVCPFCGFAFTENTSDKITDKQKLLFKERISDHWKMRDFGGERTWDEAMQTYKLALLCAQIKGEKDSLIAGLLHHIAWLHRYKGEVETERKFMGYALEAYIRVYELEGGQERNARLMYLIGELNRRLDHYHEAVRWFARVINDKSIVDSGMIRACREQWMTLREDMLAKKLELPEEMQQV